MPAALYFSSRVCNAGYAWTPADQWNLVADDPHVRWAFERQPEWRIRSPWNEQGEKTPRILLRGAGHERREVPPTIEDSALFRNFAAMEPTQANIAQFAGRYGNLWETNVGTPFGEWEFEIRTMRFLIELADAAAAKKRSVLSKHFPAAPHDASLLVSPYPETLLMYTPYGSQPPASVQFTSSQAGPLAEVAGQFVADAVNARLAALETLVQLSEARGHRRLTVRPSSLLAALWFQFADAIGSQRQYRQCESCNRFLELAIGVNRADRRYCSDACRSKALRRRQKLARSMRESGKTLREICKATGSDMSTVKQWLQPKGE